MSRSRVNKSFWKAARFWLSALVLVFLAARTSGAPLPSARQLVVLLAPSAALADWRLTQTAPLRGVMPTRSNGDDTDLVAACQMLAAGTRVPAENAPTLGPLLRENGVRTVVLGGNEARVFVGLPPANNTPQPWREPWPAAPSGIATNPARLARAVRESLQATGPARTLVVVLFEDLWRADVYAPLALPRATNAHRRDGLRRLHALVADLAASLPHCGTALLVLTPLPSQAALARRERFGPVLFWHSGGGGTNNTQLLTSPSTRQTLGLVAATDAAATIAALLRVPPAQAQIGAGRAMETITVPGRVPPAAFLTRRVALWAAQAREQRLLVVVPWLLAGALGLAAGLAESRPRAAGALAVAAATIPGALLGLAPAAPTEQHFAGAIYALAVSVGAIAGALALRCPARHVLRIVAALTTLLLLADGWVGSLFLGRSPLSYSPGEAARFYGIGNEASGVLLGSALVAGGDGLASVVLAALVAATLGSPRLGADAGGLIAALASVGARWMPLAPRARAAGGLLLVALVLIAAVFVLWDASRPAGNQTHLGAAVNAARARGPGVLGDIATRKAAVGVRLLVTSPWAALLAVEIGAAWWLWRKRGRRLPAPLLAASAALLLVNDGGVIAASTCLLFGVAEPLAAGDKKTERTAPKPSFPFFAWVGGRSF